MNDTETDNSLNIININNKYKINFTFSFLKSSEINNENVIYKFIHKKIHTNDILSNFNNQNIENDNSKLLFFIEKIIKSQKKKDFGKYKNKIKNKSIYNNIITPYQYSIQDIFYLSNQDVRENNMNIPTLNYHNDISINSSIQTFNIYVDSSLELLKRKNIKNIFVFIKRKKNNYFFKNTCKNKKVSSKKRNKTCKF